MPLALSAPVSVGDLLDRLTILGIKAGKLSGAALANAEAERVQLVQAWVAAGLPAPDSLLAFRELSEINLALWEVEDRLRAAEATGEFGPAFVDDARSVYRLNDRRAALKRAVNLHFDSAVIEEKSHPRY